LVARLVIIGEFCVPFALFALGIVELDSIGTGGGLKTTKKELDGNNLNILLISIDIFHNFSYNVTKNFENTYN
jgi:NDP-sugar pyrophosphorylase family protein